MLEMKFHPVCELSAATPYQAAPLPNHRHTLWSQHYA